MTECARSLHAYIKEHQALLAGGKKAIELDIADYYSLLLRFQKAGFLADDIALDQQIDANEDNSTGQRSSTFSFFASASQPSASQILQSVYSSFTILPCVKITSKRKEMSFENVPFVFRSCESLQLDNLNPLIFANWPSISLNIRTLNLNKTRDLPDLTALLVDSVKEERNAFCRLKHFTCTNSGLTFVHDDAFNDIPSLVHLNLSNNNLVAIPPAVARITNLRSLGLAYNMIDSVRNVRNLLPAITVMNLSHNRLSSVTGLDKLFCLQRLDIRHNQIPESKEIHRLTSLPNMVELYVQNNPFTHPTRASNIEHEWKEKLWHAFRENNGNDVQIDGQRESQEGHWWEPSSWWSASPSNAGKKTASSSIKTSRHDDHAAVNQSPTPVKIKRGKNARRTDGRDSPLSNSPMGTSPDSALPRRSSTLSSAKKSSLPRPSKFDIQEGDHASDNLLDASPESANITRVSLEQPDTSENEDDVVLPIDEPISIVKVSHAHSHSRRKVANKKSSGQLSTSAPSARMTTPSKHNRASTDTLSSPAHSPQISNISRRKTSIMSTAEVEERDEEKVGELKRRMEGLRSQVGVSWLSAYGSTISKDS